MNKTPEAAKSPEVSVLDRAATAMASIIERAKTMPDKSKARGFLLGAASLTALSALSVATEAQAHDPSGHERPGVSLAFSARGQSAIQAEKVAWHLQEIGRLEREIVHDESTLAATEASHERRMQDESWPHDESRGMARVELSADTRELASAKKRLLKATEKREEAAQTWTENRVAQGKVIRLSSWTDTDTLRKLADWGMIVRGNTMASPEDRQYVEFGSECIGAEFKRVGNNLSVTAELTDHTFKTVKAHYDPKLNYVVFEGGFFPSESDGRPLPIE